MDENVQLARHYAVTGDEMIVKARAAQEEMLVAGMSARIAAEARMKEALAMAGVFFAASMAHSNLALMAGDEPVGDGFILAPEAEKALDADG
jgi:hypothetical protein